MVSICRFVLFNNSSLCGHSASALECTRVCRILVCTKDVICGWWYIYFGFQEIQFFLFFSCKLPLKSWYPNTSITFTVYSALWQHVCDTSALQFSLKYNRSHCLFLHTRSELHIWLYCSDNVFFFCSPTKWYKKIDFPCRLYFCCVYTMY